MSFVSFDSVANFASSLVATAPSPATSGLSLVVTAGQGALFPATPFNAVVWNASVGEPTGSTAEIVRVTNISTDTLTITRAQEGTTAKSIAVGWTISANLTAKTITDLQNRPDVHDVSVLSTAVSTTLATAVATGLSFSIGANQIFTFDAEMATNGASTSTTGVKFSISAPTGATGAWTAQGILRPAAAGTTAALNQGVVTTVANNATMIGPFNATTVVGMVFVQGNIVNGSTAGTVTLYFASSGAATTVTCQPGSNMLAFRLA